MMNFDNQDRQEVVMLSAAKHLGAHREMLRCAQHDMADLVRESSSSRPGGFALPLGGRDSSRPYWTVNLQMTGATFLIQTM